MLSGWLRMQDQLPLFRPRRVTGRATGSWYEKGEEKMGLRGLELSRGSRRNPSFHGRREEETPGSAKRIQKNPRE